MSTSRSASRARRPRRPGDARHDPDSINENELLDELGPREDAAGATSLPVLCEEVWLLRARTDCPQCGERTAVYAMLGHPEFETADRQSSMLRRLSSLPPALDKAVREFGRGHWRRDVSEKAAGAHWHSHCERCHARLGEAFTLGADGPFQPALYKERIAIKALRVPGPFVLEGAQRHPSPPMLAWLDWFHRREAAAAKKAKTGGRRS
jgi:hypothetical protein